jgi:hypothetical protein
LDQQPIHEITSVEVNDSILPLDQYCYDLTSGWISLAVSPSPDATISAHYIYSGDLDMAVTTWTQVKLFGNQNDITGIGGKNDLPTGSWLGQNYPNPFYSSTTIKYVLSEKSFITLKIFNQNMQEIIILAEGEKPAGQNKVNFNATGLSAGIYICILKTERSVQSRKLVLLNK